MKWFKNLWAKFGSWVLELDREWDDLLSEGGKKKPPDDPKT